MFKSWFKSKKQKIADVKKQEIADARVEIKKSFQDFMDGEGRLPEGFSEPYNKILSDGYIIRRTPFEGYLDKIREKVDRLNDESGISDWFYLDESVEINAATTTISDWVKQHREMNSLLSKKCYIGHTIIMKPVSTYCTVRIMIVIDDRHRFEDITEESVQNCKAAGISFCTVVSDCKLYDLIEQKEKEITYVTYLNYHDETYADWSFQ